MRFRPRMLVLGQKRKYVNEKGETVNISPKHRDLLKQLVFSFNREKKEGVKIGVNDVLENLIEWFIETYSDDMSKQIGMKDLLKQLGYRP